MIKLVLRMNNMQSPLTHPILSLELRGKIQTETKRKPYRSWHKQTSRAAGCP